MLLVWALLQRRGRKTPTQHAGRSRQGEDGAAGPFRGLLSRATTTTGGVSGRGSPDGPSTIFGHSLRRSTAGITQRQGGRRGEGPFAPHATQASDKLSGRHAGRLLRVLLQRKGKGTVHRYGIYARGVRGDASAPPCRQKRATVWRA